MKLLIISDTHGNITTLKNILNKKKYDYVIHAGDYCIDYLEIKKYTNYVVAGNNDIEGEREIFFEIDGIKFVLLHGEQFDSLFSPERRYIKMVEFYKNKDIDVIVSGHTHIECIELIQGILCVNPGSLHLPRNFNHKKTYIEMYIENNKIVNCEIKELD